LHILKSLCAALALAALTIHDAGAAPDQVRVQGGALHGVSADGLTVFKGVPFAAPPVGKLRWRAPAPVKSWRGVKEANTFGAACTQPGRATLTAISEDCLYLNVWTPAQAASEKLPVMVWIYGGAFIAGSSSLPTYDGARFAKQGVVLVSINYRLGRFGFFAHPALTKENPQGPLGNYGLMDQIAALKWVKKNIAQFGGDPEHVTVFGESAGAMSVNYLMISPLAQGLFVNAIAESGFGRSPLAPIRGEGPRTGEGTGAEWAQSKGVALDAPASKLRALPAADVAAGVAGLGGGGVFPMIDGVLLTEQVGDAFAAGHEQHVPFLLGGNSFDASLFSPTPETVFPQLGAAKDAVIALFGGPANPAQVAADIATDRAMTEPDRFLAAQHAKLGQQAFVYYFSYVPEDMRQNSLGLRHGGEIPYVFGNLRPQATPADRAMSDAATKYWTAFAKTSNPGAAGGPAWPAYQAASDQWLEFGIDGAKVKPGLRKPQLDFLAAHLDANSTGKSAP